MALAQIIQNQLTYNSTNTVVWHVSFQFRYDILNDNVGVLELSVNAYLNWVKGRLALRIK